MNDLRASPEEGVDGSSSTYSTPILVRTSSRRTWVLVITLIVVAAVIAGLMAVIPLFKSPAQLAADASPPAPLPVTAKVEKMPLVAQVVMRSAVIPGPSFAVKASDALATLGAVVTKTPIRDGGSFGIGEAVLEYNGQPLVAMDWPFPAYRDITPGDTGPDVVQLQNTLKELGYSPSQNGIFDSNTQVALEQYYTNIGYPAPTIDSTPSSTAGSESDGPQVSGGGSPSRQQSDSSFNQTKKSIFFPAAGVVMIPRSHVSLTSLGVTVGTKISGDTRLMSLDGGNKIALGSTTPERATVLKAGQAATMTDPTNNKSYKLAVTSVGKDTVSVPNLGDGIRVELKFTDAADKPPVTSAGSTLKLTIATGGSSEAVIAVPISAVYSEQNGSSFVTILDGTIQRKISVSLGANVDGWAQVIPIGEATLKEGAKVIVGSNFNQ